MPGKQNYGDPAYWEKRYKENSNETFDWLQDWATLRPIVLRLVPNKAAAVLNLGCGNAAIAERMFDEGYSGITNVDISKEVIAQMKKRNEEKRPGLKFMVMDVRKLDFDEASFDFVLDKSTIDALYCGEKASRSVAAMLKEVKRVLRPAGFYLGLSYGQPKSRLLGYESPELGFFVSSHRLYDYLKLDVFGAKATKD
jgi:EEF1A lysine methyltransferase 4